MAEKRAAMDELAKVIAERDRAPRQILEWEVDPEDADDPANAFT